MITAVNTEPITIDGVAGPVVVATNALWGHRALTVGGQPAPRVGKHQYTLPATAGGTVYATVRSAYGDPYPTVEVNGVRHRTGPKIPVVLRVLSLLPFALAIGGGLVGGLFGALGVLANVAVARTRIPSIVKALIMVGVAVVACLVMLAVAVALALSGVTSQS
nr:hypothetical protein [Planosporangium flavigriseum]